jgi:hypothetical protein
MRRQRGPIEVVLLRAGRWATGGRNKFCKVRQIEISLGASSIGIGFPSSPFPVESAAALAQGYRHLALSSRHRTQQTLHDNLLLPFEDGVLGRLFSRLKAVEHRGFGVDTALRPPRMHPVLNATVAYSPSYGHDKSRQALGFPNRARSNRLSNEGQCLCNELLDILRSKQARKAKRTSPSVLGKQPLDATTINGRKCIE